MTKKLFISFVALCFSVITMADVRLPGIFSNSMVLQRNQAIPVWGWAAPQEKIIVEFNGQSVKTKAGKDGKWKVQLKQSAAGGPFKLIVRGNNVITVEDVLVGEVWLCSGQSNMEMKVVNSADKRYAKEIREADNPFIRHIKIPHAHPENPTDDIGDGEWKLANDSGNVAEFSSVGYFFAKKLYEELKVPIGLINSSWGGTIVETWISREALDKSAEFGDAVKKSYSEVKAAKSNGQVQPNEYPSLLFNGMINPIIPYAIKGALWYQGESNASRAHQYSKSFPLMITDWRARWKQGDFPFYFVQLASFNSRGGNSANGSQWAELRESQTATLALSNTGMAVTLDIGESRDIHPANKKDVGLRLAAIALSKQYGKGGEYSGPVFDEMKIEGNHAALSFMHADNGLVVKDDYGYLKGFEIAGADKKFYYAKADIQGNEVILQNDSVSAPVAVRYGWADDMPEANLYNKEGFPAVPFRTDKWAGLTDNIKYSVE